MSKGLKIIKDQLYLKRKREGKDCERQRFKCTIKQINIQTDNPILERLKKYCKRHYSKIQVKI